MASEDEYFVPTRSSLTKRVSHDVVVFQKRQKSASKDKADSEKNGRQDGEMIDMKKARFEVYKFAQSGLSSTDQQKSKLELAVKLGAKPRKNKGVNYKDYMKEKKIVQEKTKENNFLTSIAKQFGSKKKEQSKKSVLRRKKRLGDGILNIYGKAKVRTRK